MMKMRGIGEAAIIVTMMAAGATTVQDIAFEHVQKELFSIGGAFVNAWADYDGDGDLDLFVGLDGTTNRLYRNDKGRFADAAAAASVADDRQTRAAAWGDADGDGDPDLLVGFTPIAAPAAGAPAGSSSVLRFYRNSNGTFRDETEAIGLHVAGGAVRQPAWVDFDADGDLDLFIAFRDKPNALFRNESGRFVDVAAAIGIADPRKTVGAVWFDHDDDGDLDLVTGNMDGDANGLFSQDKGTFADVAATAGVMWGGRTPKLATNGTVRPCAADVDNDGRLDLFFANYGKNGLFLNRGGGRFEDASAAWGIDVDARYDSCAFADMDNDGDLDLYVNGTVTGGKSYPDYLYRNTGTRFEDVTPAAIGSPNGDHGVQWGDFDFDGAVDLALTGVQKEGMHWLLRNGLAPERAAAGIHVRVLDAAGKASLAGRTVTLQIAAGGGTTRQTRMVDGGSGYNAQNEAPLHFAVSDMKTAKLTLTVRQPDGRTSTAAIAIDPARSRNRIYEHRLPLDKVLLKPPPTATRAPVAGPVQFRAHDIDAKFPNGYAVTTADFNNDGHVDVIANSLQGTEVAWYENPLGRAGGQAGDGWRRHVVLPDVRGVVHLAAEDVDGDGIPVLAVLSDFAMQAARSAGHTWIARTQGDPREPWKAERIDSVPTSHRAVWADLDGDGRRELVNAPLVGARSVAPTFDQDRAPVFWYDAQSWTRHRIADDVPGIIHGVRRVNWPSDRREAILVASFEGIALYTASGRGAGMTFRKTLLTAAHDTEKAPRLGSSDAEAGTQDGARFLASIEPWHGNEVVVYNEVSGTWRRRVLFDKLSAGHGVVVADLNGDGRSDVVANDNGRVTPQRADATPGIHVFYAPEDASTGEWRYQRIEDTSAMNGCAAADLDRDTRPDIVCTGAGGVVRWYQNVGSASR